MTSLSRSRVALIAFAALAAAVGLVGCAVDLDVVPAAAPASPDGGGAAFVNAEDVDEDEDVNDVNNDEGDAVDDVDAVEPAGPPPAEAAQSCSAWTDCGPHYANTNSGFDCQAGVCACNVDDNWDEACANIGGVWSDEDCFCYVGASPMPSEDADTWLADDEVADDEVADDDSQNDDPRATRTCWWRWRESCEPDEWVDTSSYEYVCNGDDCGYEYRESGYWESGHCSGYWLRRCDDGTEKRY